MSLITDMLRKLHIIRPYSKDEIINAENENALFDYQKSVAEVRSIIDDRIHSNQLLRGALELARIRAVTFAEFERSIRQENHRVG